MPAKKTKARTSGPALTRADHLARGEKRLAVWLPAETLALLDAECERSGFSRPELVDEELIREQIREERERRRTKP